MARISHHHSSSAELFYVLSGSVQLLAGDRVLVAGEGDLAVVPAGLPHAFAAALGLRRRSADRDHSRRRAIRVLPPPGQDRHRPAVPREPGGGSGTLRHVLRRQPRLAASPGRRQAGFVRSARPSPTTRHLGGSRERVRNHRRSHRRPSRRDHLRHRRLLRPRAAAGACPARRRHHGRGHGPGAPIRRPAAAHARSHRHPRRRRCDSGRGGSRSPASATAAGDRPDRHTHLAGPLPGVAAPINKAPRPRRPSPT